MKLKLKNLNDLKTLLEKQNVTYPSNWNKVIFKVKKDRKLRSDEIWKNQQILIYAVERMQECQSFILKQTRAPIDCMHKLLLQKDKYKKSLKKNELDKIILELLDLTNNSLRSAFPNSKIHEDTDKKYERLEKKWGVVSKPFDLEKSIIKRGGKSLFILDIDPDILKKLNSLNIKFQTEFKFSSKSEISKKIIKNDQYWKDRKNIKNLPMEDKNIPDKVRLERQAFLKCIKKIKQPKYNKNFFVKNTPKVHWKDGWEMFLKVR